MPILEMTLTMPLVTALTYFFSAASPGPLIIPRRIWSWMVSKARYGLTALAP